jgi:hypothetical protein
MNIENLAVLEMIFGENPPGTGIGMRMEIGIARGS